MKILVTGAAGFIGHSLCKRLIGLKHEVVGLDNINDYYDVSLKRSRLSDLGIEKSTLEQGATNSSTEHKNFRFIKEDIANLDYLEELFFKEKFCTVIHLAAQAGVRFSIKAPMTYVQSNLVGFANILEVCRQNKIEHLVFASSSSVYGDESKIPFKEDQQADKPISLYAATKKSNELMAYSYSHLYNMRITGLRFFTVYGPWGRPDMAPMLFAKAMTNGEEINIFNNGDMERDFTYIDDIVDGVVQSMNYKNTSKPPYEIFNIGNSRPVNLLKFIKLLEKEFGFSANKKFLAMQPGDVSVTFADVENIMRKTDYKPKTTLDKGLKKFIEWYKSYYA